MIDDKETEERREKSRSRKNKTNADDKGMVMNLRGQNMDWSTQKMKKEPSEDGQREDTKTIDSSEINRK